MPFCYTIRSCKVAIMVKYARSTTGIVGEFLWEFGEMVTLEKCPLPPPYRDHACFWHVKVLGVVLLRVRKCL